MGTEERVNLSKIELLSGTPLDAEMRSVLTEPALVFIGELAGRFAPRVAELLAAREQRQARIDAGELPDFLQKPLRKVAHP